jgi:hypothetical protein
LLRINRNVVLSRIGETGLTIEEHVVKHGLPPMTFQRAVMNGANCQLKTAGKIAKSVGMSIADILEDDESAV